MSNFTLGYSPCPNDTFIFYAMTHGKIDTRDLRFNNVLLDVETLNQKALDGELDITKISYAAYGHVRDNYILLRSGGALGRGCGPLIVTKKDYTVKQLQDKIIAVPGKHTTAHMLLQLFDADMSSEQSARDSQHSRFIEMSFSSIMDAVVNEEVDAGLIIHEGRFTYPSYGLKQVIDLGQWWEDETGLPIPLGGIVTRRSYGDEFHARINGIIEKSIEYAFDHRTEPAPYMKEHSQELADDIINQHIDLYVNDYSLDIGDVGERAVIELIKMAEAAGITPASGLRAFI